MPLGVLDGRSSAAIELRAIQAELINDQGGPEECSAATVLLIEAIAVRAMVTRSVAKAILERTKEPAHAGGRRRAAAGRRAQHHERDARPAARPVGLAAPAETVEGLHDYLARRAAERPAGEPAPDAVEPDAEAEA